MKIFAIKNDYIDADKELAYLIYYKKSKTFYVELVEKINECSLPIIFAHFKEKKELTINSYWSNFWVKERIIPRDRQNIAHILRDNGLEYYDEFELLVLANGRCAQDDFYIVKKTKLPKEITDRYLHKVEDVIPISNNNLLVIFRDGKIKKCDINLLLDKYVKLESILNNKELFNKVQVQVGGYGVSWLGNINVFDIDLYKKGIDIPLTLDDFKSFVSSRVINTSEATEILKCSRQNIEDLVKRDKLTPIKINEKNKLYLKCEVMRRNW